MGNHMALLVLTSLVSIYPHLKRQPAVILDHRALKLRELQLYCVMLLKVLIHGRGDLRRSSSLLSLLTTWRDGKAAFMKHRIAKRKIETGRIERSKVNLMRQRRRQRDSGFEHLMALRP
jgi:hypothetical protein